MRTYLSGFLAAAFAVAVIGCDPADDTARPAGDTGTVDTAPPPDTDPAFQQTDPGMTDPGMTPPPADPGVGTTPGAGTGTTGTGAGGTGTTGTGATGTGATGTDAP